MHGVMNPVAESNSGDNTPPKIQPLRTSLPTTYDTAVLASENKELIEERIQEEKAKNIHRYVFAWFFVGVGALWIIGVYILLCLTGYTNNKFHLSDIAIGVMLGTGTLNVLGPAYMVSKYLFGNQTQRKS